MLKNNQTTASKHFPLSTQNQTKTSDLYIYPTKQPSICLTRWLPIILIKLIVRESVSLTLIAAMTRSNLINKIGKMPLLMSKRTGRMILRNTRLLNPEKQKTVSTRKVYLTRKSLKQRVTRKSIADQTYLNRIQAAKPATPTKSKTRNKESIDLYLVSIRNKRKLGRLRM